jgi:N-carbamoyl-L-amino-acid hydrolase
VPCKDGISHNEVEDASKGDIGAGCQILLQALIETQQRVRAGVLSAAPPR